MATAAATFFEIGPRRVFPPRVSQKSTIRVDSGRQALSGEKYPSPISSRSDYSLRI
jgi:hypothetical protein